MIKLSKLVKEIRIHTPGSSVGEISESLGGFEIGDEKVVGGDRHKIVDINPETQSVSWDIRKGMNDGDIHNYLSEIIKKLELGKKDYYDQKRLARLMQKLKFIRNTFKRSSI